MSLPINFLGREFAEARARDRRAGRGPRPSIPLHFNPAEYKLTKENTFAEIPIPGLESPPLQYVRGGAQVLSMDLLVDTSDELDERAGEVRRRDRAGAAARTRSCTRRRSSTSSGPSRSSTACCSRSTSRYLLFHIDGKPLRAKLGGAS